MGKVRRFETPHGRVYVYEDSEKPIFMPSVTTILSYEKSDYLEKLEKEIGKERLNELGEKAVLQGTAMHTFLENFLICIKNGGTPDKCLLYTQKKSIKDLERFDKDRVDNGRNLFYNFIHEKIFDNVKNVIFTEKFLWSLTNLYAGTADFAFTSKDNKNIIIDFKSASGIRSPEVVDKYKKQGSAYSIAFDELNKNKKIDEFQVWISHPNGLQIEILAGEELENKKKEFIELSKEYHAQWDIKPFYDYYKSL